MDQPNYTITATVKGNSADGLQVQIPYATRVDAITMMGAVADALHDMANEPCG